tara:strand:- start:662 stop:1729 length:1068 start_codon:yes stop_codon:yes gene_type:complete
MSNNRFEELAAKSMGMDIAEEVAQVETPTTETQTTVEPTMEEVPEVNATEDSSLKEDITNETGDESSPAPEVSFESLLGEKSEGKYETYEQIEEALNAAKGSSVSFANEQIEKLNEYVAKGGDVSEYLRTQTADYSEMDESSVVKASMRFNNPDLDNEDIDLLFQDKYKLDEDEYTDSEIRLSKIKLKQASKLAKSELIKFQQENSTPQSFQNAEADKAQLESNARQWSAKVDDSIKEFKSVDFEINSKGETFSFELNEKALDTVSHSTKNLGEFWNRYVNKDGSENITKLARDMASLDNLDSIVRNAYAQGASGGKEDVIKDIKNPSYSPENRGDSDKPLSMEAQIAAELRKNM